MPKPSNSYQQLSAELDEVMATLQQEGIDIEEAVSLYERGLDLVKKLEEYIKKAENRITEIKTKKRST